jgi:hypothetical protein
VHVSVCLCEERRACEYMFMREGEDVGAQDSDFAIIHILVVVLSK